jgi:alkanesulfonate monooxygenase SsuD/methylene tetrahydromethanopterin reductase-like flavin-dependent oxidoreductase (luciferase family)
MGIRLGFQIWGSHASWADLMAEGQAIDERPFEALFANDHFVPVPAPESVTGALDGPIFEGWSLLLGWAAATSHVRLGCLVSGVGYRNPALVVRLATALDHASGGRALLGIGAGWHEREHRLLGFQFPRLGERLDRLEEAAAISRRLLDGERVTFDGHWFSLAGAMNAPAPVQAHLPLVIGGSGEKRTLPIVARYADWWNADGDEPAEVARRNSILDERCRELGRDPAAVRRTVGQPPPMVRPTAGAARQALAERYVAQGLPAALALELATRSPYAGPIGPIADRLEALDDAGVDLAVFDWFAPFDRQTLDALADLAALKS